MTRTILPSCSINKQEICPGSKILLSSSLLPIISTIIMLCFNLMLTHFPWHQITPIVTITTSQVTVCYQALDPSGIDNSLLKAYDDTSPL